MYPANKSLENLKLSTTNTANNGKLGRRGRELSLFLLFHLFLLAFIFIPNSGIECVSLCVISNTHKSSRKCVKQQRNNVHYKQNEAMLMEKIEVKWNLKNAHRIVFAVVCIVCIAKIVCRSNFSENFCINKHTHSHTRSQTFLLNGNSFEAQCSNAFEYI